MVVGTGEPWIESDVTHDDVTEVSSAPADKGTKRRSTQSQSAASLGLPTTRTWQCADERPGTRACSPATICVLWRQFCAGHGEWDLVYVVLWQGRAQRHRNRHGHQQRQYEIRLTSILKPIFPVMALLRPSWHCQFASGKCWLVQTYDEPGTMRLLWRSWLHTTLSVWTMMMMVMMIMIMMMVMAERWPCK